MIELALKYASLIQTILLIPVSLWTTVQLIAKLLAKYTDSKTLDKFDENINN